MPIDPSVTHRAWFWPALLVAAIAAGAIIEWEKAGVSGLTRRGRTSARRERPRLRAPPEGPGTSAHHADPAAPASDGDAGPAHRQPTMDPKRVRTTCPAMAESVRGTRPDIRADLYGKRQSDNAAEGSGGIEESPGESGSEAPRGRSSPFE
jgi:hypothetical protein